MILPGWTIELLFQHDPIEVAIDDEDGIGFQTMMSTRALWYRKTAAITINLDACDVPESELPRHVIEELCHALVNELREGVTEAAWDHYAKHEECVVGNLVRAFLAAQRLV